MELKERFLKAKEKAISGARLAGRVGAFSLTAIANPRKAKWEAEEWYDKHDGIDRGKIQNVIEDRYDRFITKYWDPD